MSRKAARRASRVPRLLAVAFLAGLAHAAEPLQGIDAEREEARMEREATRAPVADAYLQRIADRIVAAAPVPVTGRIRIEAIDNRNPFVFCLGNGAMYVSTGLLARLQNDSQVALLLSPEITGVLAPNLALQNEFDARNGKHVGAKLLAVMATGGLAVFPIMSAENKALFSQADALILDNDITAATWARRAGFDVAEGPVAIGRLREQLGAEKQFGKLRLSSEMGLERRRTQLQQAIATLPAETAATPSAGDSDEIRKLARVFSLMIGYDYLNDSRHDGLPALLDRIEREYGIDGGSACLRAQYLREVSVGAVAANVIDAFKKCVAQPDAPVVTHRELAFLQRDAGDPAAALISFESYLRLSPDSVDAPIIKVYIEDLRSKTQ